jgi:hypothetical protein
MFYRNFRINVRIALGGIFNGVPHVERAPQRGVRI